MQGGFGQMQQAGMQAIGGNPSARPTRRNAWVFGFVPIVGGVILNSVFSGIAVAADVGAISAIGSLLYLGCMIWFLLNMLKALDEMRNAAGNASFPRWPIIIPIYNLIYWLTMVPKEVQKAKQMRGLQPVSRSLVFYFFFPVVALQSDLNDLAG